MKHGWVPALVLTALALSGGCRVGYEELKQLGFDEAGGEGSGGSAATATGGTSGGNQGGSTQGGADAGGSAGSDGGEAGDPSTGGTDTTGGSAGSSTGGGGTTGGTGGGRGGAGGAGPGGGGTGGAGGSAGSTAGGGSGGTGAGGSGGSAGAPNPALCNTGMFGGHTYLLCKEDRSWFVANQGCAVVGMRLVRIDDAAENQWLFDNAFTEQGRGSAVWIGATDQAVEGEWRWTDGALFWIGNDAGMAQNGLFAAWQFREPNNVSTAEHCAVLETNGSTPEWYDYRCELVGPFICESL